MNVLRLPQSPVKILQPSSKGNQQFSIKTEPASNNSSRDLCPAQQQQQPDSTDENRLSHMPFKKHHHSVKKMQTPSVSRRNARERNRVKQVNNGFATLRTHIPHLKNKTSKVDTLRAAVDYIRALRNLMGEPINEEDMHKGPVLITDVEEQKSRRGKHMDDMDDSAISDLNESLDMTRPISVASDASMNELPPMVYQLPHPINPTMEFTEHPRSPTSSSTSSAGSGRADFKHQINKLNYLDDLPNDIQGWDWTNVVVTTTN